MRATHKDGGERKRVGKEVLPHLLQLCECLVVPEGRSNRSRTLGTDGVVFKAMQWRKERSRGIAPKQQRDKRQERKFFRIPTSAR